MKVLVADIGGTNARFAIAEPGTRELVPTSLMTAGLATFEDALTMFLDGAGTSASNLAGAVISGAGPVREDGAIHMTNGPWDLVPAQIQAAHSFPFVRILNDMTAAALALPGLEAGDVQQIGGDAPEEGAAKAVIAPGTGLGTSGLLRGDDGIWVPLASEGGHISLAPQSEREIAVVFHLVRQYGHASIERVLSGSGLEVLYQTLGALDGGDTSALSPVDIAAAARRGEGQATEVMQLFSSWLGAASGDIALLLGAKGGVYLAGGLLPRLDDLFDRAMFRRRMEAKGRFDTWLKPVPAYLVNRQDLGLLGCLRMAERSLS